MSLFYDRLLKGYQKSPCLDSNLERTRTNNIHHSPSPAEIPYLRLETSDLLCDFGSTCAVSGLGAFGSGFRSSGAVDSPDVDLGYSHSA